jgi:phage portal protein BeeE
MGRIAKALGLQLPTLAATPPPELTSAAGAELVPIEAARLRRLVGDATRAAAYPSPLRAGDLDPAAAAAFGFSADTETVTRREAMRVPAVRRARAVIAGTIGAMTWQCRRGHDLIPRQLVDQPSLDVTPQFVWTWTVDDLFFRGISWWRVLTRDSQGYPEHVERLAAERVTVERNEGVVYVDSERVPDADLIRFDGPDEGVLEYGATTLRTCLLLEAAVRKFARLDVPLGFLRPAEGAQELSGAAGTGNPDDPEDDRSEIDVLLDEWESARSRRSTAFLNRAVEYETVMFDAARVQLAEARQHQATEVARLTNLPPRYVNAPQASGMTYSNTESDRRDLLDTSLDQYVTAIAQRLSMPDVTPRGQRIAPDIFSWLRGDTAAVVEAGATAIAAGVMGAEEVRTEWLGLPARTSTPTDPTDTVSETE